MSNNHIDIHIQSPSQGNTTIENLQVLEYSKGCGIKPFYIKGKTKYPLYDIKVIITDDSNVVIESSLDDILTGIAYLIVIYGCEVQIYGKGELVNV